jgi:hypothetical protein
VSSISLRLGSKVSALTYPSKLVKGIVTAIDASDSSVQIDTGSETVWCLLSLVEVLQMVTTVTMLSRLELLLLRWLHCQECAVIDAPATDTEFRIWLADIEKSGSLDYTLKFAMRHFSDLCRSYGPKVHPPLNSWEERIRDLAFNCAQDLADRHKESVNVWQWHITDRDEYVFGARLESNPPPTKAIWLAAFTPKTER